MRKACSKCGEIRLLTEFGKDRKSQDGHRADCKVCRKNYLENPVNRQRAREASRKYAEKNKEKVAKKNRLYKKNNKEKLLLQHARRRARKKDLPFSIVEEDITIPDTCPVLGIQLFSGEGVTCDNSPNLDRIIPEKGYVPGNVRVISCRANRIKNNATVEELRAVLKDLQKQLMILESEIQYET
jgi:hypothetical protein